MKNISVGCSRLNPLLCHTYETGGVFQRRQLLAGEVPLLPKPHCSYTLLIPLCSPISPFSFSKKRCAGVVFGPSESFYFSDYSSPCQVQFPCLTVNNERGKKKKGGEQLEAARRDVRKRGGREMGGGVWRKWGVMSSGCF